jgi:hypothetical protein
MASNNTPLAGLVGIILVVAAIAAVAGLAISGTDLLNPKTSDAIWQEKTQAVQSKTAKDAIDLEAYRAQKAAEIEKGALDVANYKAVQAARAQAEQDKIRLDVQARERELAQNLELARQIRYVAWAVGALAILIVSVGVAVCLIQLGHSRLALAQAQATQANPWHNPTWRTEQIRGARKIEAVERESALVWRAAQKAVVGGNGKHPPKDEPLESVGRRAM